MQHTLRYSYSVVQSRICSVVISMLAGKVLCRDLSSAIVMLPRTCVWMCMDKGRLARFPLTS